MQNDSFCTDPFPNTFYKKCIAFAPPPTSPQKRKKEKKKKKKEKKKKGREEGQSDPSNPPPPFLHHVNDSSLQQFKKPYLHYTASLLCFPCAFAYLYNLSFFHISISFDTILLKISFFILPICSICSPSLLLSWQGHCHTPTIPPRPRSMANYSTIKTYNVLKSSFHFRIYKASFQGLISWEPAVLNGSQVVNLL